MLNVLRHTSRTRIYAARSTAYRIPVFRCGYSTSQSDALELDDAPILRIVKSRVGERARLLSELSADMSSPSDIAKIKKIKALEPVANAWKEWTSNRELLRETVPLLDDPDPSFRALAVEDHTRLSETLHEGVEKTFPELLLSTSSTAGYSALMELKSGVGGSEASLFLGEMLRMYERLAADAGWRVTVVSSNETENGGVKDAVVEVEGQGAYDTLRWESGVHRVQRVPATETSGRTHTSTVAVVVLPVVEEVETDGKDDLFNMEDVRIEVMRARGAGGQHVNKTESAIRLTHVPTGISVSMQDERSQHQNKRRAFQVLRARLMDRKLIEEQEQRRAVRRNLVRGADRSEKVRTYNFAQDRVTDHRIGLSVKNLQQVMEGDALRDIIDALKKHNDQEVLEDMLEGTSQ